MIEKIIRADGLVVSLAGMEDTLRAAGVRCIEAGWLAGVTTDGEIVNQDILLTATDKDQGPAQAEEKQQEPAQQGEPEQQPNPTEDEIKTKVIEQHAKRLPAELKTRQQIIAAADKFADWIKVDLSKALDCKVVEVPAKLADWMGFSWSERNETAAEEENTEK